VMTLSCTMSSLNTGQFSCYQRILWSNMAGEIPEFWEQFPLVKEN
jgi:hypothetical protein